MKTLLTIGILLVGLGLWAQTNTASIPGATTNASAASAAGIAVMIVYDGSGSMADPVPGIDSKPTPKFFIANKAVNSIIRQLLAYSQGKHVEVQAGLVDFVGGKIQRPIPLLALTPETAKRFVAWTRDFRQPEGGTPLGAAILAAQKQLATSQCLHQHILVITDGMSNAGPPPEKVLKKLRNGDHPVPVYFVAFDVAADLFKPVKEEGAMVVSASDETQLNTEINAILGQKILLEAE
jgi:hypothetical protein